MTIAPSPTIDEVGARDTLADGDEDGFCWDSLVRVEIVTNDLGPFLEDFFWVLHDRAGASVSLTQDQASSIGLLGRLQQLQGFDNQAVIRASCCTEDARFVCWAVN